MLLFQADESLILQYRAGAIEVTHTDTLEITNRYETRLLAESSSDTAPHRNTLQRQGHIYDLQIRQGRLAGGDAYPAGVQQLLTAEGHEQDDILRAGIDAMQRDDAPDFLFPFDHLHPRNAELRRKLQRVVTGRFELDNATLPVALQQLAAHAGVAIMLDHNGLAEETGDFDLEAGPVTGRWKDFTLDSILQMILSPFRLEFTVQNEVILVGSRSRLRHSADLLMTSLDHFSGHDRPAQRSALAEILSGALEPRFQQIEGNCAHGFETYLGYRRQQGLVAALRRGRQPWLPRRELSLAEQSLQKKLAQRVTLEFQDRSYHDIVGHLRTRYDLPLAADRREEDDTRITFYASDVTLETALQWLAARLTSHLSIRREFVALESLEFPRPHPTGHYFRTYPLGRLSEVAGSPAQTMLQLAYSICRSESAIYLNGQLLVETDGYRHRMLDRLFSTLEKWLAEPSRDGMQKPVDISGPPGLIQKLHQPCSFVFYDTPCSEVAERISAEYGIRVNLAPDFDVDAGARTPLMLQDVSYNHKGQTLASMLEIIGSQHGLYAHVKHGAIVLDHASQSGRAGDGFIRIYDIAALVRHAGSSSERLAKVLQSVFTGREAKHVSDYLRKSRTGCAAVAAGDLLVVSATVSQHIQIEALLKEIQRLQSAGGAAPATVYFPHTAASKKLGQLLQDRVTIQYRGAKDNDVDNDNAAAENNAAEEDNAAVNDSFTGYLTTATKRAGLSEPFFEAHWYSDKHRLQPAKNGSGVSVAQAATILNEAHGSNSVLLEGEKNGLEAVVQSERILIRNPIVADGLEPVWIYPLQEVLKLPGIDARTLVDALTVHEGDPTGRFPVFGNLMIVKQSEHRALQQVLQSLREVADRNGPFATPSITRRRDFQCSNLPIYKAIAKLAREYGADLTPVLHFDPQAVISCNVRNATWLETLAAFRHGPFYKLDAKPVGGTWWISLQGREQPFFAAHRMHLIARHWPALDLVAVGRSLVHLSSPMPGNAMPEANPFLLGSPHEPYLVSGKLLLMQETAFQQQQISEALNRPATSERLRSGDWGGIIASSKDLPEIRCALAHGLIQKPGPARTKVASQIIARLMQAVAVGDYELARLLTNGVRRDEHRGKVAPMLLRVLASTNDEEVVKCCVAAMRLNYIPDLRKTLQLLRRNDIPDSTRCYIVKRLGRHHTTGALPALLELLAKHWESPDSGLRICLHHAIRAIDDADLTRTVFLANRWRKSKDPELQKAGDFLLKWRRIRAPLFQN